MTGLLLWFVDDGLVPTIMFVGLGLCEAERFIARRCGR